MRLKYRVLSIVACAMLATVGSAQQTNVVRMPIIVVDPSNHVVKDLKQEELRIVENKIELHVVGLERSDERVKYVIALDTSGSFRSIFPYAAGACLNLIEQNRPKDETALVSFVGRDLIAVDQSFTSDKTELLKGFQRMRIKGGQSAVIDGAYFAVQTLLQARSAHEREALVLVSDGEDRNSTHSYEHLDAVLRQTGVQVFVIGVVNELDKDAGFIRTSPRERAEKLLTNIANDSHGRVFFPKNQQEMVEAALEISKNLRSNYYVTFEAPDSKPGKHEVEITLNRVGVKLKLASGSSYYVSPQPLQTNP